MILHRVYPLEAQNSTLQWLQPKQESFNLCPSNSNRDQRSEKLVFFWFDTSLAPLIHQDHLNLDYPWVQHQEFFA